MSRRPLVGAVIAACSALLRRRLLDHAAGQGRLGFDDPFRSRACLPSTGRRGCGPTRKAPSATSRTATAVRSTSSPRASVSDIEDFWESAYGEAFDGEFTPVEALISWDANGYDDTEFCGEDTYGLVNAAFCHDDHTIGWDRGELLPALRKAYGDMGVTDGARPRVRPRDPAPGRAERTRTRPTLVSEQQADCFAGAYMRWVAEGNSPRFTLSHR